MKIDVNMLVVPDVNIPATIKQQYFTELRRRGFYSASEDSLFIVASREDWGVLKQGTFPEEGKTPKYWRDNTILRLMQEPGSGVEPESVVLYLYVSPRRIQITSEPDCPGFSDPSFEVYSLAAATTYREFADVVTVLGGVPALEMRTMLASEAVRFNVTAGQSEQIPIATMPSDYVLIPIPDTGGAVAAMQYQQFAAWARAFREKLRKEQAEKAKESATATPKPAAAPATVPEKVVPPSMVSTAKIETHEGMDIDTGTGEAIVNGIETGWYFGLPAQVLPIPGGNLDTQAGVYRVSPWAFATASTAQRVLELMQKAAPDLQLRIVKGDDNARFPTSIPQRFIGVEGVPSARVNAGLVASYIARSTFFDSVNRKNVQTVDAHIAEAVASLRAEVAKLLE